jgi:copper homeostasis protein
MKIELCVSSKNGIDLASKYKVDRIELCQNLEIGGTTPSPSLVKYAVSRRLETHVLIRPRMGGFVYSDNDIEMMCGNIEFYASMGVKGFVFGCLDEERNVNKDQVKTLVACAPKCEFTFHRAFDDLVDWRNGIEDLSKLGVSRLLTSGLAASVDVGMNNFTIIKELSKGKVEMMIGGGVTARNIPEIIKKTCPDAIHFSATSIAVDTVESKFNVPRLEIDETKLIEILGLLK